MLLLTKVVVHSCLIAFVLGYLVARMMRGNGLINGESTKIDVCEKYKNNQSQCCADGKCKDKICKFCPEYEYNRGGMGSCKSYYDKCNKPTPLTPIFCDPTAIPQQMCPPGNIPCPQCGDKACACPSPPSSSI